MKTVAKTLLFVCCSSLVSVGQDPIAESITASGVSIDLIDIAQLPTSRDRGERGGLANTNILVHAGDNSGRVFVNDMRGKIYVLENDRLVEEPFLDLTTVDDVRLTTNNVFQGFTTFAFHPDFARPNTPGFGKLYTATDETPFGEPDLPSSREPVGQHSVLAEWSVDPTSPNRVDPSSRREIMRLAWPTLGHKMDQLAFNPNAQMGDADYGMLYISLGDGGDTANTHREVDFDRNGQNTTNLFGTIARIDPLGTDGRNGNYGIPNDNPLRAPAFQPETWAYGFRNPHRFSWDRIDLGGDGRMFISDIGQASIEEVSIGLPGGNYGWSEREGTFVVNHDDQFDVRPATAEDNAGKGFIEPAIQYDHSEGRAIVGGFVVRSSDEFDGDYFFGDLNNGRIFRTDSNLMGTDGPVATDQIDELMLNHDGETKTLLQIVREQVRNASRTDLRFGRGQFGEIYVLTKQDGFVRKLVLPVPGDYDMNGSLGASDIDHLAAAIRSQDLMFDLNSDGQLDKDDLHVWIADIRKTWVGDANLDGRFNATDFVSVFSEGYFQTNEFGDASWRTGDWNGDRKFDTADFVFAFQDGGYEQGPRFDSSPIVVVPEPAIFPGMFLLACLLVRSRFVSCAKHRAVGIASDR